MIDLDNLTEKYANRSGGGHYRKTWGSGEWCCDRCQTIYDALVELNEHYVPPRLPVTRKFR